VSGGRANLFDRSKYLWLIDKANGAPCPSGGSKVVLLPLSRSHKRGRANEHGGLVPFHPESRAGVFTNFLRRCRESRLVSTLLNREFLILRISINSWKPIRPPNVTGQRA
jgi:hypothetical protein